MSDERTPSGTPILRHEAPEAGFTAATTDEVLETAVGDYLEEHVGPAMTVFHELVSDVVHIDVHVIPPTPERATWVLYTTGMSALPMTIPPGAKVDDRAELVMSLPADWLPEDGRGELPDDRWWPIGVMKYLARLPHRYRTWLGVGHTVPNGDPANPYHPGVPFTGVVLLPPVRLIPEPWRAPAPDGRHVRLLSPVFLTTAEMDFKLARGLGPLVDRLDAAGIFEMLDVSRAPVVPG